ncbi:MAG: RNA-binding S4 domain-containing protein [Gammaproteobacteria bacterium]|nr:RNA-binding S4 domain-containing protein [Gammaproteobacteria bacterium]
MEMFNLAGRDYVALCDLLKLTGQCHSGGMAKWVISDGQVSVDGEIELRKRCKIRQGQSVKFNEQSIVVIQK